MSSPTPFKVRPATLRDAKAIAELHNITALEAIKSLVTNVTLSVPPVEKRQAYWREAIEYSEPQVYVALNGDSIAGFVGFDRSRDKGTPPTMGEIWALYVSPALWGSGAGLALWDAARDGLLEEGCSHVTIWLPLASDRALRFHELAGFKRELTTARTGSVGNIKVEEIRLKRELT